MLEGKFGEKEQEFIRDCFRRGEKKMISGFEQMMNEKEERAEKRGKQQGMQQGIQQGIQQGMQQGMQQGIRILIEYCRELGNAKEETVQLIAEKYSMEPAEAGLLVEKYW